MRRNNKNTRSRSVKKDVKKIVKLDRKIDKMSRRKPNQYRRKNTMRPTSNTYRATAPVAKGYKNKFSKPKFKGSKDSIFVTHSEYLGTVTASDPYSAVAYRLNPADPKTFPWLSTLANSYEKYNIISARARYVANCSTTTFGKTFLYFDYNPNNVPITDIGLVLNTMDAVSGSPWMDKTCPFRRQYDAPKTFLVRSPYVTPPSYLLYDPATLYVGTIGSINAEEDPNLNLGEIWIDYEIELSVPDPQGQIKLLSGIFQYTDCAAVESGTSSTYYPNMTTGTFSYSAGNFLPTVVSNGFTFNEQFTGVITLLLTVGDGFTSGVQPVLQGTNGAISYPVNALLSDTFFFGADAWMIDFKVFCPQGSSLIWNGMSSTTDAWNVYCAFATSDPRYWNSISVPPPFTPTLSVAKKSKVENKVEFKVEEKCDCDDYDSYHCSSEEENELYNMFKMLLNKKKEKTKSDVLSGVKHV